MRYQGRITRWKDDQGYGFILPNLGGEEVFVHIKAFKPHQPRPAGDEIVTYELARDASGRPRAAAAAFVSGGGRHTTAGAGGPMIRACLYIFLFHLEISAT